MASIRGGRTAVTLMDCIAAMPWGAGRRRSADITNAEKAKNTPPTAADPTAVATASTRRTVLIGSSRGWGCQWSYDQDRGDVPDVLWPDVAEGLPIVQRVVPLTSSALE